MLLILPTAFMNQLDLMLTQLEDMAARLETKLSTLENLPENPEPYDVDAESLKLLNQMAAVIGEIELINESTDHYKDVRDILKLPIIEHTVGDALPDPAEYPYGYRLSISTVAGPDVLNITSADLGTIGQYGKTITVIDRDNTFSSNPLTVIFGTLDNGGEVHGDLDVISGNSDLVGRVDLNGTSVNEYHMVIKDADSSGVYLENLTDQFVYYLGEFNADNAYAFGRSTIRRIAGGAGEEDLIELERLDGSVTYLGKVKADGTKCLLPIELSDKALRESHLIVSDNVETISGDALDAYTLVSELGNDGFLRVSDEENAISPEVDQFGWNARGTLLIDDPNYEAVNLLTFSGSRFDGNGDTFAFGIHNWHRKGLTSPAVKASQFRHYNDTFFITYDYFAISDEHPVVMDILLMQARINETDTENITYDLPGGGTANVVGKEIAVKGLALIDDTDDGLKLKMFGFLVYRTELDGLILSDGRPDEFNGRNEGALLLPNTASNIKIVVYPHNEGESLNSFLNDVHVVVYYEDGGTNYIKHWRFENGANKNVDAETRGVGQVIESNNFHQVDAFGISGYYDLDISRYVPYPDVRGIMYAAVNGTGVLWAEAYVGIPANVVTGDFVGFGDGNNTIVPGTDLLTLTGIEFRNGRDGLGVAAFLDERVYYFYQDGYYYCDLPVGATINDVHCFNKNGNIYICALTKDAADSFSRIYTLALPDEKTYSRLVDLGPAYATALPIFNVYDLPDVYDVYQKNATLGDPVSGLGAGSLEDTGAAESSFAEKVAVMRLDTLNTDTGMAARVLDVADIVGQYSWMLRLPQPL